MSITEEAIDRIADLGAAEAGPNIHQAHGVEFLITGGSASVIKRPRPEPVHITTLTGVIAYLKENKDDLELEGLTVKVRDAHHVDVIGSTDDVECTRSHHLTAAAPAGAVSFASTFLGRFMPVEDFVIGAQQRFLDTEELRALLAVVGNAAQSDVRQVEDDGISQAITVKAGVIKVAAGKVPNPVRLIPRRSFPEINDQLAPVPFIVRVKAGGDLPHIALFECDGGAGEVDAIAMIAGRLRDLGAVAFPEGLPFAVLA